MPSSTFTTGQVLTAAQMNSLAIRVDGYSTTATAAGTTVLTVASNLFQVFTGTTTETVTLPVTSTLGLGWRVKIINDSTGIVTVQSSGANTVYAIPAGVTVDFICILITGTTAASWLADYPAAATGALTYITGATFSAVGSVSLPNNTFTGTYANYKVMFSVQSVSVAASYTMRMRASGTDSSASLYNNSIYGLTNNANLITFNSNIATSWTMGSNDDGGQGPHISFDIFDPQVSQKTFYTGTMVSGPTGALAGFGGASTGGFFNATTVFDALTLIASTGTITGYYKIYGYANS